MDYTSMQMIYTVEWFSLSGERCVLQGNPYACSEAKRALLKSGRCDPARIHVYLNGPLVECNEQTMESTEMPYVLPEREAEPGEDLSQLCRGPIPYRPGKETENETASTE